MADDTATASTDDQEFSLPSPGDLSIEDWLAQEFPAPLLTQGVMSQVPLSPVAPIPAAHPHASGSPAIAGLTMTGPRYQQFIGAGTKTDPWRDNLDFVPTPLNYGNPDLWLPQWRAMWDPTGMQQWARQMERAAQMTPG